MIDAIVRRFQARVLHEPTVDYRQQPPIRPRPPVTAEVMAEAEARLGFPLPPLLRAFYTQVGDGGFGPGRGLLPLIEGDWSLVAHAERSCVGAARDPLWPPKLVEIVSWGCHYMSCVDCAGPPYPVWFYDFDRNVEDPSPQGCLCPENDSLAGWFIAWLDGVNLWASVPKGRKLI